MAFDIYGNTLRPGYCEVHPDMPESYPCSQCDEEIRMRYLPEQQYPEPEQPEPEKDCQSCRAKIEADKEQETKRKCWEEAEGLMNYLIAIQLNELIFVRCFDKFQELKQKWLGDK